MKKNYIDVPSFTHIDDIESKNYTLSATQYKSFDIKNNNIKPLSYFLDRELTRSDLGNEVGSESYVSSSSYSFIKTKALQQESYLLDKSSDAFQYITPQSFVDMKLKEGDVIISKDSNVGEIVILEKNYPNSMLCGGLYRLPISKYKYYLLAIIKSELFRQQIDFLVPRGSTIRHGKTKFLDCFIPLPNKNADKTIKYVECLMKAIINKEKAIKEKHSKILNGIMEELTSNQKNNSFIYSMPTIQEIESIDRFDSNRYCEEYQHFRFLLTNYKFGCSTLADYGYKAKRGQNLQVSAIGKSIYLDSYHPGFYYLVLSQNLSTEGRILDFKYLGNENKLSTLNKGDIVFSARGQCLGRSFVVMEQFDNLITNIDSMIFYGNSNTTKACFIHLMLDLYRSNDFIKKIGINGSGAESVTKYQLPDLIFPDFPDAKEKELVKLYYNPKAIYDTSSKGINDFDDYDDNFNKIAGIYELDKSLKYLQEKLQQALDDIANDEEVTIAF